ncbi:M35 family metallo-endopeptidase [Undibacterium sp. MH2W]|uniref:M35 family metallo-endopeptidase n=1 Tax=Undibacterium sp. MH2W TaxID=3413044 RepID=UPI003BF0C63A
MRGSLAPLRITYVKPNDANHLIYVGELFWSAPMTGIDSKAGTLMPEMSHWKDVGATKDGFPEYNGGFNNSDLSIMNNNKRVLRLKLKLIFPASYVFAADDPLFEKSSLR